MPGQLEELMKDLLELAEIESGTRRLILATFRPVELVRPVVERHRPSAECKQVELEVDVWPDLPASLLIKKLSGESSTTLRKRSQSLDSPAHSSKSTPPFFLFNKIFSAFYDFLMNS
jgi:hypothetical protein